MGREKTVYIENFLRWQTDFLVYQEGSAAEDKTQQTLWTEFPDQGQSQIRQRWENKAFSRYHLRTRKL